MPKKKLSDIVLHRISPPDFQDEVTVEDLAKVLVRRIGLQRKKSRADHAKLLLELMKFKKEKTPITIEKISDILGVSISQTYEEIRKWRSLGIIEFTKTDMGFDTIKGYMLSGPTVNRLLDHVESSLKGFLRETRRIAKDFDDNFMLSFARDEKENIHELNEELKQAQKEIVDGENKEEELEDEESSDVSDTDDLEQEENDDLDEDQEEEPEENKEKKPKKSLFEEFGKS
ncbi:hypothetical protein CL614_06465 [archaeon]|nr:hypothetical protein [archaeon]